MLVSRTLFRSIAGEIVAYSILGCATFLLVLATQNVAQRLEELLAVGLTGAETLLVVRSLLPMAAAYAVPVGFLLGVLVTVGRMSGDSEITALRSCGQGLGALLAPALTVGALAAGLTGVLMLQIEPESRQHLRTLLKEVASRGGILRPGEFRSVGQRVVYVERRTRDNQLEQVLVADRTNPDRPFLVFAERGRFHFDPEELEIRLELENGDVHLEAKRGDRDNHRRIAFERFDYAIDATPILETARHLRPRDLTFDQLQSRLEQAEAGTLPETVRETEPLEYRVQLHRRLALTCTPLLFAAVGVPLGLRRARGARSWGALLCVALVSAYYMLLSFGQFLAESGAAPAWLGLWLPNLGFGLAALLLLQRARRVEV